LAQERSERRTVPVKLFRTPDRVTAAAPMPGLYAEDITVDLAIDNRLVLDARPRGQLKPGAFDVWPTRPDDPHGTSSGRGAARPTPEQREVVLDEREAGACHRDVELPVAVGGTLATVTSGNGIASVVAACGCVDKARMPAGGACQAMVRRSRGRTSRP
jgi:HSP20 family molecular chaperone IbpA